MFEWLQGLLGLAPGDNTGVLLEEFEEEQFVEVPVSLRMGFVRLMLETGGFILSVATGAAEVSAFFSFTPPVLVELPSNTINGLFLPLSVLELKQNSYNIRDTLDILMQLHTRNSRMNTFCEQKQQIVV